MRATLAALGVGALGCVVLFVMLTAEKNRHADTRSTLAAREVEMAQYAAAVAASAAERARAVEEAVALEREATERYRRNEEALRLAVDQLRNANRARLAQSDARIEVLLHENEELRAWASARVPDAWVDWLRGELVADPPAAAGGSD